MKKKALILIVTAVVAVSAFTGCANNKQYDSTTTSTTTAPTNATTVTTNRYDNTAQNGADNAANNASEAASDVGEAVGDAVGGAGAPGARDFNPRPPRGGRLLTGWRRW